MHHSSEYFNLSTALRQSATGALFAWPFYLPMALLGVPPVVFAIVALIDLLYQYWVHTELVGRLGPLDRILVTPSNHRVHHGQNDYCIDRNYGGMLIIWDRLFGTFTEERDTEPVIYGVRKPLKSYNALWGNLNVFSELWQRSRTAANFGTQLKIWFGKPSAEGIARAEQPQRERWTSTASPQTQRYVTVQYALLAIIATYFFAIAETLTDLERIGFAGWIATSIWALGALLDDRRYARRLETLRLLGSLMLISALALTTV